MKPGIDLSTITRIERITLILGLALFLNALIPWWYRVRTARETFLHNGGLYGWGIVAALAGFASVAVVVARHTRTPATFNDRFLHAALGLLAVAGLLAHATRDGAALWIGFWVEWALAAALAIAGAARVRERNRGWV